MHINFSTFLCIIFAVQHAYNSSWLHNFYMLTWLDVNFVIDVETINFSTGEKSSITCGGNAVIRIDNATVHAHESYCATNMNNECVLSDDDFESIETRCNNNTKCTVDYPKNTSCLKEDRYFNLSYSCLGNGYFIILCTYRLFKNFA